jgi:hypothetical protein
LLARDDNGIKVGAEWFSVFPFGTHTVNPDDGKEKRLQGLPEGLSKRVELAFEAEAAADNAGVCVCVCVCVHACMRACVRVCVCTRACLEMQTQVMPIIDL